MLESFLLVFKDDDYSKQQKTAMTSYLSSKTTISSNPIQHHFQTSPRNQNCFFFRLQVNMSKRLIAPSHQPLSFVRHRIENMRPWKKKSLKYGILARNFCSIKYIPVQQTICLMECFNWLTPSHLRTTFRTLFWLANLHWYEINRYRKFFFSSTLGIGTSFVFNFRVDELKFFTLSIRVYR